MADYFVAYRKTDQDTGWGQQVGTVHPTLHSDNVYHLMDKTPVMGVTNRYYIIGMQRSAAHEVMIEVSNHVAIQL